MARYFGVQSFKTSNEEKDVRIFYQFGSKKDLVIWLKSDMSQFTAEQIEPSYQRQKISRKQAKKAEKSGEKFFEFKPFKQTDLKGQFLHIKHPEPKYDKNFGVVIRFDDKRMLNNFLKRHRDYYKGNAKRLKASDSRVVAATVNGAFMKFKHDKQFDTSLKMALKNFNQLDPSRNHLALISQKDWSEPEVYSFTKKSARDHFVDNRAITYGMLPIKASKLNNFHPIAIDHAAKGKILTGNWGDHFNHMGEYLDRNNPDKISKPFVSNKKLITQMDYDKSIGEGKKDFKNLDMRSVDLNGHSLTGMDFSGSTFAGQNLDGVKFDGVKAAGADFKKCSLNGTSFVQADLQGADFKNSSATQQPTNFHGANLSQAGFKYCDLPGADFKSAILAESNFLISNLEVADLSGAILDKANFTGVSLQGAKIDLKSTSRLPNFKAANLKGTTLENTRHHRPQTQQSAMQM
jgi:uncharacterized protein YjbI with pentapeptide repeats